MTREDGCDVLAYDGELYTFRALCAEIEARAVEALWRSARAGRALRRLAYTFVVLLLWLERHRLS